MKRTLGALFLAGAAVMTGFEPVRVGPCPQKFRTFYSIEDHRVPEALRGAPQPLPAPGITAMAAASDGAVWMGTPRGLIRFNPHSAPQDRYQYFAGLRYLQDDEVLQVVPDGAAGMWVRTRKGVSHLELKPMRLAEKAAYFEERVRLRHDRYGLVADSTLPVPGDLGSSRTEASDNDGLWTAMYAASQCYRYAITQSPEALASARRAVEAVLFLEKVTGRPGFPARSYIRKGDRRPPAGVWHWTKDGSYEWKSDTSSDEIVGHYYILGLAWDLLPDERLKKEIAATTRRITDHILANGYNLTDIHGQPTYWGRWSPQYFQTERGRPDSPLNAAELLSFLKTAAHVTGEARYEAEYRKVALDMKYAELAGRLLELREELNYSDEELAMLSFDPLFRYEKDDSLRTLCRRGLEQWWQNIRREKNPLWIYIYQAANPAATADLADAAWMLRRIPMDLVSWNVTNSHRSDLQYEAEPDRFGLRQVTTLLPPDERPVMKWNGNPFRVDGGSGGRREDDGAFFLLPYWMGRYHGYLIEE